MAKVITETMSITFSRLVKQGDEKAQLIDDTQRELLAQTIVQVCEQVLEDSGVIIEINQDT